MNTNIILNLIVLVIILGIVIYGLHQLYRQDKLNMKYFHSLFYDPKKHKDQVNQVDKDGNMIPPQEADTKPKLPVENHTHKYLMGDKIM